MYLLAVCLRCPTSVRAWSPGHRRYWYPPPWLAVICQMTSAVCPRVHKAEVGSAGSWEPRSPCLAKQIFYRCSSSHKMYVTLWLPGIWSVNIFSPLRHIRAPRSPTSQPACIFRRIKLVDKCQYKILSVIFKDFPHSTLTYLINFGHLRIPKFMVIQECHGTTYYF